MNEKVFVGPKFGTLINRKGLQYSELLQKRTRIAAMVAAEKARNW
jgi:hypothetical protein